MEFTLENISSLHALNTLEVELDTRLNISSLLNKELKDLPESEQFLIVADLHWKYGCVQYKTHLRKYALTLLKTVDKKLPEDVVNILEVITPTILSILLKEEHITALQAIYVANEWLESADQREFFGANQEVFEPYRKGIKIFVLGDM